MRLVDLTLNNLEFTESGTSSDIQNGSSSRKRKRIIKSEILPAGLTKIDHTSIFKYEDDKIIEIEVSVGTCVELKPYITLIQETTPIERGYFLRVTRILAGDAQQYFQGMLFQRCRYGHGIFEKKSGDLFWRRNATVKLEHIVRVRELVLTNHIDRTCGGIFPREDALAGENIGRLICRHRAIFTTNPHRTVDSAKHVLGPRGSVRMLFEHEADEGFRFPAKAMKKEWMKEKYRAIQDERDMINSKSIDMIESKSIDMIGSGSLSAPERVTNDTKQSIKLEESKPQEPEVRKTYTFADFFCGCGGASYGAKMAGLQVNYGIDSWKDAIDSYAANFGLRKAFNADITDFAAGLMKLNLPQSRVYADVVHFSCPCQFYSPVHTVPGKDDEKNEAASLVINNIIEILRPRVVTMEQTFGLDTREAFFSHFTTILNQFVRHNYSLKWEEVEGIEHGTCSRRCRLIIIASCPGEFPTAFPAPIVYNPLKKGVPNFRNLPTMPTVRQVLATVPPNAQNNEKRFFKNGEMKTSSFEMEKPLNKTITCDGGDRIHPDGTRPFTVREVATFQTFPVDYQFSPVSDTKILKQVGNAWPPQFAKAFFQKIVKHLEELDRGDADNIIL